MDTGKLLSKSEENNFHRITFSCGSSYGRLGWSLGVTGYDKEETDSRGRRFCEANT